MPPPRKSSPRRRERRSRSRSHSPRHRRKSRSHSRSKDRRSRSRSAQRRRSPERKPRSPKRRSPSPRRRSRSPKRRSRSHSPKRRSRSHSQRRRSRSHSPRRGSPGRRRSPSPGGKDYPVKRPADSSVKRHGYRSRSASPVPVKKSREERLYREESPYDRHRVSKHSQSPVHESQYGGKMYADKPSSSRQPLFPAGTSKHVAEIDYVTIVDRGPPREKLNKRFETLEQASQGPFDFEENITIGIHRGPQHIQLEGDDDIEVNYDFNPKTFKMLFPKKDYAKAIFDRDEIKAFHHDDILDEEAYVEKRTISIKPVDKPKSRKRNDELDYKITVGSDREGYGDRRMVHDSRSRQRPSSSRGYDDVPVTVRLDPRPDPRYEKIYKEQQRYEDHALMQEKVQRNPNDLRYNLMRRRSDGDRDLREAPPRAMDARSRIEARRQESTDRRDRQEDRRTSRGSPPGSADRKQKTVMKTDLPDFKNRPGVKLDKPVVWIIGSSVVKDMVKFGETFPDYDIATMLKDDVSSVVVHGEIDLKIEDMLPAVRFMLKTNKHPQMIVFQCGEQNVGVGRNVDIVETLKKDLVTIRQEIPNVVLVWSQMLPPWMAKNPTGSTLAKSRRRINRFMMQCFVSDEIGGAFLYHPLLRTNFGSKYHMKTTDGFLHLKKDGMKKFIYQLQVGIRYLMTGHGSIFPYMKWPMKKSELTLFEPERICMLNIEQIQSLNEKKLSVLSAEQVQALSNEQILMFSKHQLPFVYCEDFVQKLSSKQLKSLSKNNFYFLSYEQLDLFKNPDRFNWLSEEVQEYLKRRMKGKESGTSHERDSYDDLKEETAVECKKKWIVDNMIEESDLESDKDDSFEIISSDDQSVINEKEWVQERMWYSKPKFGRRPGFNRRGRGRFIRGRGARMRGRSGRMNRGMTFYRDDGRKESGFIMRERERHRRSASRNRYRSLSRESGRSHDRDRFRRSASLNRKRSRNRDRQRSLSRERLRSWSTDSYGSGSTESYRSKSRERYRSGSRERQRRRSYSNERSRERGYRPPHYIQAAPQPVPYSGIPFPMPPGGQMPFPFHGQPPPFFSPMPFPAPPMSQASFPSVWPDATMQATGQQPLINHASMTQSSQPKIENWGDGMVPGNSSVNTSNLKEIT